MAHDVWRPRLVLRLPLEWLARIVAQDVTVTRTDHAVPSNPGMAPITCRPETPDWGGRRGERQMQQHHPVVRQCTPDSWIVGCPECQRDNQHTPPVGINLPVSSMEVAVMLATNHAGRKGLDRKLAG